MQFCNYNRPIKSSFTYIYQKRSFEKICLKNQKECQATELWFKVLLVPNNGPMQQRLWCVAEQLDDLIAQHSLEKHLLLEPMQIGQTISKLCSQTTRTRTATLNAHSRVSFLFLYHRLCFNIITLNLICCIYLWFTFVPASWPLIGWGLWVCSI